LRKVALHRDVNVTISDFGTCIGESCAWYVKETDECAVKCLAARLEFGEVKVVCETLK
jgi:hypothetical protein